MTVTGRYPPGVSHRPKYDRRRVGRVNHQFPDVPGLILRTATEADITPALVAARAERDSPERSRSPDAYVRAQCERDARWQLEDACLHPEVWAYLVEYDSRPLKFESVDYRYDEGLYLRNTQALDLERPSWFWRECAAPVWKALARAGYREWYLWLSKRFAHARPFYEQDLRGTVTQDRPQWWQFTFSTDAAPAFTGWPARKTAGPGWTFSRGDVDVRELHESDLAALDTWLRARWGAHPRKEVACRMLREWYLLDRATLIGGYQAGVLKDIRALRHRLDTTSSVSYLSPLLDAEIQPALVAALRAWHREVGYVRTTAFVPEAQWAHPRIQAQMTLAGWQVVARHQFREPFVEIEALA